MRFVLVFVIAAAIGFGAFFLTYYLSHNYIDNVYLETDNKKSRERSYIRDLQDFVDVNGISSENTSKLSEWAKDNKYVYLIIYKDNELFYTSDDPPKTPEEETDEPSQGQPPEQPPAEEPEKDPEEIPEDVPGTDPGIEEELPPDPDEPVEEDGAEGEDALPDSGENEPSDAPDEGEGEKDDGKGDGKEEGKKPDGVTVDYPTREELFEYARKNDLYPLELADGTMFASLTEFTEYLYYDISNILSIVVALIIVLIILTSYFQLVTTKIIRLGNEVNKVAAGDINHVISAKGNDEIAKLSVNVENMRESMLENFEKEREALDANTALITSMSHDIRTPLTVLLGYIDVMNNKTQGDAEMQEYLRAAESTALRLKKLSDDMFGYFLVFGGKELEINLESYDAATLVDQMLFEHVTLMRESGYTVDFDGLDYDSLLGMEVRTDAQKLIRIFDNVFSNVYKYADKSCAVSISAERREAELCIKFANVISNDTSRAESNGIGLKTCKKLAEYINAVFESENDGERFEANLRLKLSEKV